MYTQRDNLVIKRDLPTFTLGKRQASFARKHEEYNRSISKYHRDMEMLCRLLDVRAGMRILEIGGGVGYTSFELANLGASCVDIDICPGNAEFVSRMAEFYDLDVVGLRGDTCHLPFGDNIFDAVYSKDAFEHIWDFESALNEQTRVLKKHGRLCILVGNLTNPKTFYTLFVKRFFQSRGRKGGLRWLLTKGRAMEDFGIGWHGKDEDIKTRWWWRKKIRSSGQLDLIELTTTRAYNNPSRVAYRIFEPFVGSHVIMAKKR